MARELEIRIVATDAGANATLAKTETSIEGVEKAAGRAVPALAPVSTQLSGVASAAEKAGTKMSAVGGVFQKAGGLISGAVTGLVTGAAAGAVLGLVDRLGGMAAQFMETSGHVADLSEKLHVSTDTVQRWKFAVEQTGGSMAALSTSAITLFKSLAGGKDSVKAAVEDLGLNFDTLRAMAPEKALEAVADAIGRMEDPMRQASDGAALMGRGFATNLPAMQEGLTKLGDEAERAGAIMSGNAVQGGDKLGDALGKLKDVGLTLLSTVLTPFLPVLSDLAQILVIVLEPFGKLLELVLKPVGAVLTIVGDGIKYIVSMFTDLGAPVGVASTKVGEFWSWLHDKIGPVIDPIIGLLSDLKDLFFAFGELVWAVNVRVVTAVAEMVTKTVGWIVDKLKPIFAPLKPVIEIISTTFTLVKNTVLRVVEALYTGVKLYLVDKFTAIVDGAREKIQAVTGFFKDMYQKVVGGSYVPDMVDGIGAQFGRLAGLMVDPAAAVTGQVTQSFGEMGKMVGGFMDSFAGDIAERFSNLIGHASSWKSQMSGLFHDLTEELVGFAERILKEVIGRLLMGFANVISGSGSFASGFTGSSGWGGFAGKAFGIGGSAATGGSAAAGGTGAGAGTGAGLGTAAGWLTAASWAGGIAAPFIIGRLINKGPMYTPPKTDLEKAQEMFDYGGPTSGYFQNYMEQHPELWGQGHGFRMGTGGEFRDFGAGRMFPLHGDEAVVRRADGPNLAQEIARHLSERPMVVRVTLDGKELARNQVRHIPRVLNAAGI